MQDPLFWQAGEPEPAAAAHSSMSKQAPPGRDGPTRPSPAEPQEKAAFQRRKALFKPWTAGLSKEARRTRSEGRTRKALSPPRR